MKKLVLLLALFLISLSLFSQVKDDEFVSDVQWIIAPVDSMFIIEFTTDDKFKYVKYGKSVYYKPRDFLMFADDEYVFERLDEIEHFDLFGYPTITTIKRE